MSLSLALTLEDNGYSFAALADNQTILFSHSRKLNEANAPQLQQLLVEDLSHYQLIGHTCKLILLPGQYQLLLTDAPANVDEKDLGIALRWSIKGLTEYAPEDSLIEAFRIPSPPPEDAKAFAVITSNSEIKKKTKLLLDVYLEVESITISEFALRDFLIAVLPDKNERYKSPLLILHLEPQMQRFYLIYHDVFYLIRELFIDPKTSPDNLNLDAICTEIQRSSTYCLRELDLPEPTQIIFTPNPSITAEFQTEIENRVKLKPLLLDLNHYFKPSLPISLADQKTLFFSVAGAVNTRGNNGKD